MQRAEFETKLNRVCLHIYREEHYEEDYQMPMLRQNRLDGILEVDGCEVEGKARYTYEISGLVSMKSMYENTCIKKQEIQNIVIRILEVTETLQKYMLNPNCLVLKPEYIFYKEGQWFFCYFPDMKEDLCRLFHELTEYFVRMLDYEDMEGIFLAYELHKATLQEHYDLELIMREYKSHETERKKTSRDTKICSARESSKTRQSPKAEEVKKESLDYFRSKETTKAGLDFCQDRTQTCESGERRKEGNSGDYKIYGRKNGSSDEPDESKKSGNIFYVTEEEDIHEKKQDDTVYEKYESAQAADPICEKGGWWKSWRKAANGIRRKRWGSWDDLILETDGQEPENGL